MYTCDSCSILACRKGDLSKAPKNCPCHEKTKIDEIKELYNQEQNKILAYNSAKVEAEGYCKNTRLEEIIDFSKKCNFNNLGIAFCTGLRKEAKILSTILRDKGFTVNSIICKNGSIPKEFIGIKENEKVRPNTYEPICNPIGQAKFLNSVGTDLNILLGLCVGHDSLFIKYSDAPVTIFAVKDRVLCHNPIGILYQVDGYYNAKLTSH